MAVRVAVYQIASNKRSRMIAAAMREGVTRCGDIAQIVPAHCYREPTAPIAVFYGYDQSLQKVFTDYRRLGLTVVYVDLGYWGRREGGSLSGYHKVSVNGRHPTEYFQLRPRNAARFEHFGVRIRPWRGGEHILVAGMSAKAAEVEGFAPEQWERTAIATLRQYTQRKIIYRPKPSWTGARPIPGCGYEPALDDLDRLLVGCHAVVTHHSNAAIDGILNGVPAISVAGAGSVLSLSDFARIEDPWRPEGREQFAADLAWQQFTPEEMRSGFVWRHLKNEGLI